MDGSKTLYPPQLVVWGIIICPLFSKEGIQSEEKNNEDLTNPTSYKNIEVACTLQNFSLESV